MMINHLTGHIEDYIMIAMGSLRNTEINKQTNAEYYRLSKGFHALNLAHQKEVLKTARGLLRIQRSYKTMLTDKTRYIDFPVRVKKR
jgi:hypothetical protein